MSEDLKLKIVAEVDQAAAKLKEFAGYLEKTGKAGEEATKKTSKLGDNLDKQSGGVKKMSDALSALDQVGVPGIGRLADEFSRAEAAQSSFLGKYGVLIAGLSVAAAGAAITIGKAMLEAGSAAEQAEVKLTAALKASGTYSESSLRSVQKWASQLQSAKGVNDELSQSLVSQGLQMGLTIDASERLISVAADMTERMGSVPAAFDALARAASGNERAIKSLGRTYNIITTSSTSFVDLLTQIEEKTSGNAAALVDTYAGAWKKLGMEWSDLLEGPGKKLAALLGELPKKISHYKESVESFEKIMAGSGAEVSDKQLIAYWEEVGRKIREAEAELKALQSAQTEYGKVVGLTDKDIAAKKEEIARYRDLGNAIYEARSQKEKESRATEATTNAALKALAAEKAKIAADEEAKKKAEAEDKRIAAEAEKRAKYFVPTSATARASESGEGQRKDADLIAFRDLQRDKQLALENVSQIQSDWEVSFFQGQIDEWTAKREAAEKALAEIVARDSRFDNIGNDTLEAQQARLNIGNKVAADDALEQRIFAEAEAAGYELRQKDVDEKLAAVERVANAELSADTARRQADESAKEAAIKSSVQTFATAVNALGAGDFAGFASSAATAIAERFGVEGAGGYGQAVATAYGAQTSLGTGLSVAGGVIGAKWGPMGSMLGAGIGATIGDAIDREPTSEGGIAREKLKDIIADSFGYLGEQIPTIYGTKYEDDNRTTAPADMAPIWTDLENLLTGTFKTGSNGEFLAGLFAAQEAALGYSLTLKDQADIVGDMVAVSQELTAAEGDMMAAQAALWSNTKLTTGQVEELIDLYREGKEWGDQFADVQQQMVDALERGAEAEVGSAEAGAAAKEFTAAQNTYVDLLAEDARNKQEWAAKIKEQTGVDTVGYANMYSGIEQSNVYLEGIYENTSRISHAGQFPSGGNYGESVRRVRNDELIAPPEKFREAAEYLADRGYGSGSGGGATTIVLTMDGKEISRVVHKNIGGMKRTREIAA